MVKLRAAHSNNPRLAPLRDGAVQATGIDFEWETLGPQQLFHHQLTQNDFDVFEFSISSYMMTRDRDPNRQKWDWVGIPVFLSRAFLALNTYVNTHSGMESFADLKGKRFGIPDFQMTAGLWMRAMIEDLYGVRPRCSTQAGEAGCPPPPRLRSGTRQIRRSNAGRGPIRLHRMDSPPERECGAERTMLWRTGRTGCFAGSTCAR